GPFSDNFPMALDEPHHRIFVGTRSPARLLVLGTGGQPVADVACVGDADDLFLDPERDRVYVTGGEGFVDVFDVGEGGRYQRLARLVGADGAGHSLGVPGSRGLFVAAPRRGGREAAIHVYEAPAVN